METNSGRCVSAGPRQLEVRRSSASRLSSFQGYSFVYLPSPPVQRAFMGITRAEILLRDIFVSVDRDLVYEKASKKVDLVGPQSFRGHARP